MRGLQEADMGARTPTFTQRQPGSNHALGSTWLLLHPGIKFPTLQIEICWISSNLNCLEHMNQAAFSSVGGY